MTAILHGHKGACDHRIDIDRQNHSWDELSHHLLHLCDMMTAEDHHESFEMFNDALPVSAVKE